MMRCQFKNLVAKGRRPFSSSVSDNPLLRQSGLPLFEQIHSEHMLPAVRHDLDHLKTQFSQLEQKLETKSEAHGRYGVIEELERLQHPLEYSWGVMGHLMGVKNSDELRCAHSTLQPDVIEVSQAVGQSRVLFDTLSALKDSAEWDKLDQAQQRIVEASLRGMMHSGVGLDGEERQRFNELQLEVSELSTKFSNNVLDSTNAFSLVLTSAEDAKGLPQSALVLAATKALEAGYADASTESGPWLITLDMPSYLPAMQHLQSRSVREQLYRAYVSRASVGEFDNSEHIRRILQIKQDISNLLGYNNYAEMSLASKMAPSIESVHSLIDMLREKAFPAAQKELLELQQFAEEQGHTEGLALWDVPYWAERLKEARYDYNEEELRVYFPLPSVLRGLFSLAQRLFGIDIVEAEGEAELWNGDVMYFKIFDDESRVHLASFYLDAYSRPSEKRGGAWMATCQGKSQVMDTFPVAYLTCNGSPPLADTPSLMTFREVETLFHEFGHGLQHMLTQVQHGGAAGINNVEWDAVELPSQFMENWCYDHKTLYSFACHYDTGAPLPEELYQKIKASKNFQAGMITLRQLFFGTTDLVLHSDYDPYASSTSPFQIQQDLAPSFTVMPPLKDDRFLCSFGHIFAGGYAAGYYSYKWAEVMSADAFAAFEEVGLDNEDAVIDTGRRFRKTVLSMGGGAHPSDVYKLFRGREPCPLALVRHSGLE